MLDGKIDEIYEFLSPIKFPSLVFKLNLRYSGDLHTKSNADNFTEYCTHFLFSFLLFGTFVRFFQTLLFSFYAKFRMFSELPIEEPVGDAVPPVEEIETVEVRHFVEC